MIDCNLRKRNMREDILRNLQQEIYNRCQKESNKFGIGCYQHIVAVVKNAEILAGKYGADKEEWLDQNFWGVSNKVHYFEEKMYGTDNIDIREPIRIVLKEYFG